MIDIYQLKGGIWMASALRISEYLVNNKEALAAKIVDGVLNKMDLTIPELERKRAVTMHIELMESLGEYILNEEERIPESLLFWSKRNAAMVSFEGKISTIAVRYPPTRDVITDILTELGMEYNLGLKELSKLIKQVNRLLDISLNETIETYEHLADEYRLQAQIELAEVSTPIVPVKDGVVILPLVGYMNSCKAQYIMERVIPKIADSGARDVIVDFSGVPSLEVEMAFRLKQIAQMLRLMGIHVITTGISPKLAQLVVHAGIDLSQTTFLTLKQALESLEKS
jgi:rsbT co-antagonist protein RsbR